MPDEPVFRFDDLKVTKLVCRVCAAKHGREDATFNRPPESLPSARCACPRCGSPDVEVKLDLK